MTDYKDSLGFKYKSKELLPKKEDLDLQISRTEKWIPMWKNYSEYKNKHEEKRK